MKRRWRWIWMLSLFLLIPTQTYADSPPPPPQADYVLHITHAPDETVCVVILTREPGATKDTLAKNLQPNEKTMVDQLFSLTGQGWYPVADLPEGGLIRAAGDETIEWIKNTALEFAL